jgi:hypothetical protein
MRGRLRAALQACIPAPQEGAGIAAPCAAKLSGVGLLHSFCGARGEAESRCGSDGPGLLCAFARVRARGRQSPGSLWPDSSRAGRTDDDRDRAQPDRRSGHRQRRLWRARRGFVPRLVRGTLLRELLRRPSQGLLQIALGPVALGLDANLFCLPSAGQPGAPADSPHRSAPFFSFMGGAQLGVRL